MGEVSMVERVARAIATSDGIPEHAPLGDYLRNARAVIGALRPDVLNIVAARRAVYVTKQDAADALAEDTYNQYDQYGFAIEAIDWLQHEIDAALAPGGVGGEG